MGNFWSVGTGGDGTSPAIPKRNFRFLVNVGEINVWIAKSTQLPNFSVGEAKVHFVNHEFKYPGKVSYQDLQINLIEAVSPNTSYKLLNLFSKSGYKTPDKIAVEGIESQAQTSVIFKHSAVSGLGTVTLTHLGDEGPNTNNIYYLQNAWIKNITLPQSLDYSNEEVSDVQITFAYDYFTMKPGTETTGTNFAFTDSSAPSET